MSGVDRTEKQATIAGSLGRAAVWLMWHAIRLPVFLYLAILEP